MTDTFFYMNDWRRGTCKEAREKHPERQKKTKGRVESLQAKEGGQQH